MESGEMSAHIYLESDTASPVLAEVGPGRACVYTRACPGRDGPNEDAAALIAIDEQRCVLVLADGFGGHPSGARAAAAAVRRITAAVSQPAAIAEGMMPAIVTGFEEANREVREWGIGAAATLSVVTVNGRRARSFHVGDSDVLITGQRGKLKHRVIVHSPVGYAVESGLIDEQEAMNHEDRHVVSNMVGAEDMRIELGPVVTLAVRDTVLIASDGLWDNLRSDEIVNTIRKGPLARGVAELARLGSERMEAPQEQDPSKPDDLTIVAFRLR